MKYISSTQNPQIKTLKGLQDKARKRAENNQFVIEGIKELTYAIQAGYLIDELYVSDSNRTEKTDELIQEKQGAGCALYELSAALFKTLCYRSTSDVLGVAQRKEHSLATLHLKDNPLLLIAEAPEKPGNIGALARTVDAAKADALIITNPKTDLYNPNVIRSSVGCMFSIPIAIGTNEEVFSFLKSNDIKLFSAALSEKAKVYTEENYTSATAIAVGTEDIGLSNTWCNQSKNHIVIPMLGVNDSLNVSVAAGIILFEAIRQRK
ncbi:RNA methyltransferase [Flavobacteriaceae bacterium]|nr:RNA methyltransferase [Flavobacteriaceae bacterium]